MKGKLMNEILNKWLKSSQDMEFNCANLIKSDGSVIQHDVATLQPPMSDNEFQELKEDLLINGQLQPIYVIERFNSKTNETYYQIVDGRHRVLALNELDIGVVYGKIFKRQTPGKVLADFVESIHKRRNLTATQKAIKALYKYLNSKNKGDKITIVELAKKEHISKQILNRANYIYKKMGKQATDALFNGRAFIYGGKQHKNINQLYTALKADEDNLNKELSWIKAVSKISSTASKDINPESLNKVKEKAKKLLDDFTPNEIKLLVLAITTYKNDFDSYLELLKTFKNNKEEE
jgi:hypothetical protein